MLCKFGIEKNYCAECQHNSLYFSRGDRTLTCDILVPNQVRYQLRYAPIFFI